MNLLQSLVIAFAMYSKIPMPRVEWNEKNMRYALCFFPLVGAVIGAVMYGWIYLSLHILELGDMFRSIMCALIPIFITGGIHMDGYLDTCDAKSSYAEREKRLEIMKDPHAGAFAIIWGMVILLLQIGGYSAILERYVSGLCFGFVLSRTFSGLSVILFPNAKKNGLATAFKESADAKVTGIILILELVVVGILMLFAVGSAAVMVWAVVGLFFAYYHHMCIRDFGGVTGDLAGWFLTICETLILITFVGIGWFL